MVEFKTWFWKTELFLRLSVGFFAGGLGGVANGIVTVLFFYTHLTDKMKIDHEIEANLYW